ncbi:MAG: RagB/SusD family nutrient uptake outer membrane protein, partial [Prevotellaceae bacterium]|nr:RagB/SusD family nutrient uptake outer membrane protein [Prevotellaceae bacterium]
SIYSLNFTTVFTLKETLVDYFLGLSADQANLTAATDEAMWTMTQSQIEASKNNPKSFFLPEIHTWDNAYAAIELIDKGLAYINNGMLTDVQGLTSAELYFLEAYLYFELFRAYGGVVPVLSDFPTPTTNDEMVDIITKLGEIRINSNTTPSSKTIELVHGIEMIRPTKWAAYALLGRLYLYYASPLFSSTSDQSKWAKALTYLDAVINSREAALQGSYEGIWRAWGEDNKEILFGVHIKTKDNAYEGLHPTQSIVDQYGDDSGKKTFGMEYPNNDIPLYEWEQSPYNFIKDHRFEVTIQTPSSTAGYSLVKSVAHIMPIIRYGEVLLNCAEAYFNTGNNAKAYEYVNKIRQRAGFASIPILNDIKDIKQERLIELAFEGHRFWDVRRWKQGEDCFGTINAAVVTEQNEGPLLLTRTPIKRTWIEKYNFYPVSRK